MDWEIQNLSVTRTGQVLDLFERNRVAELLTVHPQLVTEVALDHLASGDSRWQRAAIVPQSHEVVGFILYSPRPPSFVSGEFSIDQVVIDQRKPSEDRSMLEKLLRQYAEYTS